ncbi:MAG: hypothetical protein ACRDZR_12780, partial [Acidimicrobiales bacterium]
AGGGTGPEGGEAAAGDAAGDAGGGAPGEPGEDGGARTGAAPQAGGEAPEDPDAAVRARGAELLDPIVATLARRVKRALQDEQNALLDRLRGSGDSWSEDLLAPEEEQRARYVEAASPALRDAAAAGIAMARELRAARGRPPSPDAGAVAEAAEGLAATVVTLLRRRLAEGEDGGSVAPADRVGAAFREWRGERIERLVGDCTLAAFSSGVLTASGKAAGVHWLVGGGTPACADCDDNALAGTVPPGDEFPTGHRHPPAHAGCRCLVLPTPG